MKAIIGGTGVDTMEDLLLERRIVSTSYGQVELFVGQGHDEQLVFLPRHGSGHSVPPHLINYRANIAALSQLGVDAAIGIYAVGSISERLAPAGVGFVSDFIDLTGGNREQTYFTGFDQKVVHVDMAQPFDQGLRQKALFIDPTLCDAGVYACTQGPRLETKAEIRYLRSIGCDIVGMTLATEVVLLREMEIPTLALAYSINWAAGVKSGDVDFLDDQAIKELRLRMTILCRNILT